MPYCVCATDARGVPQLRYKYEIKNIKCVCVCVPIQNSYLTAN